MFTIKKTFEFAGAHKLNLPYESKCQNLHGHGWWVTVHCRAEDEAVDKNNGMVVDFTEIKKAIHDVLDHTCLTNIYCQQCGNHVVQGSLPEINPTAENIARWICHQIPTCYKVKVQESSGNIATYIDDSFNYFKFNEKEVK